jgi:hypothetical protein
MMIQNSSTTAATHNSGALSIFDLRRKLPLGNAVREVLGTYRLPR